MSSKSKQDQRRVTMQDIADVVGVTKATVSLALKNDPRISKAMRATVAAKAEEMQYRPSPLVNALMQEIRTQRISEDSGTTMAVLVAGAPNDKRLHLRTYNSVLEGIKKQAETQGFRIEIFFTQDEDTPMNRLQRILRYRGIRGLIYFDFFTKQTTDLPELEWDSLAVITFSRFHPELRVNRVLLDYQQNTSMALDHLRACGCRRIGLPLGHNLDAGLNYALSSAYLVWCHLHQDQKPIPFLPMLEAEKTKPAFIKWMKKHKPDGIITHQSGIISWLKEEGFRVPEDVAVALTNVDEFPEASGVDNRHEVVGGVAINVLGGQLLRNEIGQQEVPRLILVPGRWKDGETTGPALNSVQLSTSRIA
ncbi:MAG: LacI family DNA-binding transcriptional regulator [Verrucomicrobia bacterium]|nr:LacI family DNA-binding transcriptional regulator [Verrucomicrobiota bacterium]MCH8526645.1 LacI family transcriptional regulator [Kiritimatiellia bacterium]